MARSLTLSIFIFIFTEFEYQKSKDSSRMKQPFAHTSPKDHPFNRFTWGNNQSFSGQEPKALRDCAMKLFRKHFIGASMKLIIIDSGNESFGFCLIILQV